MASEKHYQGDAALYAALSQFLIRGYNPAKPLYDEADSDDFWIDSRKKNGISRCQARSSGFGRKGCKKIGKKKEKWVESLKGDEADATIQFPQSILEDGVDLVVMCLFHKDRFFVGLFDSKDINELLNEGCGGNTNRKEKEKQRPTISFRWSIKTSDKITKVFLNKKDVSSHFDQRCGKWDELFPSKFDFSESRWKLTKSSGSALGVLRLKESGAIESREFPSAKWLLASGETKNKKPKRLVFRLDPDSKQEIEFTYKSSLDNILTSIDNCHCLVADRSPN